MKIVSIDIETTGLNLDYCQILEIGAVIVDTDLVIRQLESAPKFKCIVDNGKEIKGEPYAINMHSRIFKILADLEDYKGEGKDIKEARTAYRNEFNILTPGQVADAFYKWLIANNMNDPNDGDKIYINVCGKNFSSFDLQFIKKHIPNWESKIRIRSRVIDPAVLFYNYAVDDQLPGLQECMKRAGIEGSVTHDALQDAIDTAKVVLLGLSKLKII